MRDMRQNSFAAGVKALSSNIGPDLPSDCYVNSRVVVPEMSNGR